VQPQLRLDERCNMHWFDLGEIEESMLSAEGRELPHCLQVRAARVRVADMRAEKVAQSVARVWPLHKIAGRPVGAATVPRA
jgi:hypothetical protein